MFLVSYRTMRAKFRLIECNIHDILQNGKKNCFVPNSWVFFTPLDYIQSNESWSSRLGSVACAVDTNDQCTNQKVHENGTKRTI